MNVADAAAAVNTALAVGVLGLDQTAFGQVMVSQPLVGGAIVGWLAGDPAGGLLAGAFFQFLCLTDLPVGASVPPDTALAGLVGSGAFLLLGSHPAWSQQALLGLCAAAFLPLAFAGRALDILVKRLNRVWSHLAESLIGLGHFRLAQLAATGGLVLFFLRGFLVALVSLLAVALWGAAGLERAAAAAPGFGLLARCVPLLGLATLVAQRSRVRLPVALAAGFAAGVLASGALAGGAR